MTSGHSFKLSKSRSNIHPRTILTLLFGDMAFPLLDFLKSSSISRHGNLRIPIGPSCRSMEVRTCGCSVPIWPSLKIGNTLRHLRLNFLYKLLVDSHKVFGAIRNRRLNLTSSRTLTGT